MEIGKGAKVAVGGPKFFDAMVEADRGDAGIVDFGAFDFSRRGQGGQGIKVSRPLTEQSQSRTDLPGFQGLERRGQGCWWVIDSGVGHDGKELVDHGPGDRPGSAGIRQHRDAFEGWSMPV